MIEKSTIQKVLAIFFNYPAREFYLRELSRELKLAMHTVISTTDILAKEGLIIKTKGKALTKVIANRENPGFINYKRAYNLEKIYDSKLIDYLISSYNNPKMIILFGSYSKGEDTEKSDIDMAVATSKKTGLDIKKYEKELKRGISIHEIDLAKVSREFKNNLHNGIVLEGSW